MRAAGLFLAWAALFTLDAIGNTIVVYVIGRYVFGFWS